MPFQPAFQPGADVFGYRLVVDLGDRVGQERQDQQALRRPLRHSARTQVEQRRLINRPRGRAMRTFDVIGINFKLWLGQKLAVVIQQQGLGYW